MRKGRGHKERTAHNPSFTNGPLNQFRLQGLNANGGIVDGGHAVIGAKLPIS
jgi:hypothetical protein